MRIKSLVAAICATLIVGCLTFSAYAVEDKSLDVRITGNGGTEEATPINMSGMMPGDKKQCDYTVNLSYKADVRMTLKAKLADEINKQLASEIMVETVIGEQQVFSGTLAEFAEGQNVFIAKMDNTNHLLNQKTSIPLKFTFSLPETAGNEVANSKLLMDIILDCQEDDIPANTDVPIVRPVKTGDEGTAPLLMGIFMAAALMAGFYLYKKGSKGHDSKK